MMDSNVIEEVTSFSIDIIDNAFSRFCAIVERNLFLIKDSLENERSPSQTVTGKVKNSRSAVDILANVNSTTGFFLKYFSSI